MLLRTENEVIAMGMTHDNYVYKSKAGHDNATEMESRVRYLHDYFSTIGYSIVRTDSPTIFSIYKSDPKGKLSFVKNVRVLFQKYVDSEYSGFYNTIRTDIDTVFVLSVYSDRNTFVRNIIYFFDKDIFTTEGNHGIITVSGNKFTILPYKESTKLLKPYKRRIEYCIENAIISTSRECNLPYRVFKFVHDENDPFIEVKWCVYFDTDANKLDEYAKRLSELIPCVDIFVDYNDSVVTAVDTYDIDSYAIDVLPKENDFVRSYKQLTGYTAYGSSANDIKIVEGHEFDDSGIVNQV